MNMSSLVTSGSTYVYSILWIHAIEFLKFNKKNIIFFKYKYKYYIKCNELKF